MNDLGVKRVLKVYDGESGENMQRVSSAVEVVYFNFMDCIVLGRFPEYEIVESVLNRLHRFKSRGE